MPRYAEPVPAPSAKKAVVPLRARTPQPQQQGPQRGAIWHAIQLKAAENAAPPSRSASPSALPASLRAGVETLSGIAMSDVRVHRNSAEPARLGALAYAQGTDIHLGPGQERHLPHEAWHVVQQKQGRVTPTVQLKGVALNESAALEAEADAMGARAVQMKIATPENSERAALREVRLGAVAPIGQLVAVDLYRNGNANSPRMNNVRNQDVTILDGNVVPNQGGVSTNSDAGALVARNLWRFPANTDPPAGVGIVNDHHTHYAWQSTEAVALDTFKTRLEGAHASFVKV
jgi:hypothetical protein